MTVKSIDHISIAVRELGVVESFLEANFGLKVSHREEIPDQGVRIAFLDVGGVNIELIEPLDEASGLNKYLDKRGPGIHHIALSVDNINDFLSRLKGNRVRLTNEEPQEGGHGKKMAFVHPGNVTGALIELCED
ncbi:methylmalonyl-CoA epimerase [bacterium]|nr:methylmalonyl-CoA epimerase [bacterium]